ncbi:MAG: hypothetical protein K6D96_07705 [Acetatifactor sp.]|nr:hypothetical protein [Acetatifactor sp.]
MGFFSRLFNTAKREKTEDDWEQIVYSHDDVDFDNEIQRTRYITGCLEQMADASKEIDLLSGEYSLVTSYLTDIEEIEALPFDERESINFIAKKLDLLVEEKDRLRGRKTVIDESNFRRLSELEDDIEDGIKKIKEAEEYDAKVKSDLRKLDGERHAYEYRRDELDSMRSNYKGMTMIVLVAVFVCLLIMFVMQYGLHMKGAEIGIFISVVAGACAITFMAVKYIDADKEALRVGNSINKLILLQNKVKIRYVNNTNLLDYLYLKFGTDSGKKLEKQWKVYNDEKELRKMASEAEARCRYYEKELVSKLANYHIKDPGRWVKQTKALLDRKEMVEIRHELIKRRQNLRKQMDYNKEVADVAQNEVRSVADQYPRYAKEILELVSKYETAD